jgi:phosphoribosylanthranilate isomerase
MLALMRTRVKFCGITRIDDALAAAALGVDALGFVFTRQSKRYIALENACVIRAALPPFVVCVALFMDDDAVWVAEVLKKLGPDYLQFHGNEDASYCDSFASPYLKAIAMGAAQNVVTFAARYPRAAGFLLDSHALGATGGSGETFDWTCVPRDRKRPLLLAGGLTPHNVADAIRQVQPYGVDVSSGIEATPGVKDNQKMRKFIEEVNRVSA